MGAEDLGPQRPNSARPSPFPRWALVRTKLRMKRWSPISIQTAQPIVCPALRKSTPRAPAPNIRASLADAAGSPIVSPCAS